MSYYINCIGILGFGKYNKAQFYYNTILEYEEFQTGEVYYYLGFIANQNKNYDLALDYFFMPENVVTPT